MQDTYLHIHSVVRPRHINAHLVDSPRTKVPSRVGTRQERRLGGCRVGGERCGGGAALGGRGAVWRRREHAPEGCRKHPFLGQVRYAVIPAPLVAHGPVQPCRLRVSTNASRRPQPRNLGSPLGRRQRPLPLTPVAENTAQCDSEGPDVGRFRRGVPDCDLRGEVEQCPSLGCVLSVASIKSEAKVGKIEAWFAMGIPVVQYVVWLDVPVYDAVCVQVFERLQCLVDKAKCPGGRGRYPAGAIMLWEERAQTSIVEAEEELEVTANAEILEMFEMHDVRLQIATVSQLV